MAQAMILFVEDNEDLRKNAALVLGLEGYAVQLAVDGREALDLLESGFIPNLIVSDIMMPRLDGYEFFKAVQKIPHLRGIPFIFLTARSSRQDITQGKMLGVDDYLVKPFDPEDFLLTIQNKLRRAEDMHAHVSQGLEAARNVLVQLLSHELRTPLTYVTGGFALLAEELQAHKDGLNPHDIEVSLTLIQNGTQRLNRLTEQTVLYSQIISGYAAQQAHQIGEPLELEVLVYDALAALRKLSDERRITFQQLAAENTTIMVHGVRDLLVSAFSEILRNAILFSSPGERVEIDLYVEDDFGVFEVTDHGPGIAPEDQSTIWDVLVQLDREINEQQGAGMGLPLARGIVEAHEGKVGLSSKPGNGTTIRLYVPLTH